MLKSSEDIKKLLRLPEKPLKQRKKLSQTKQEDRLKHFTDRLKQADNTWDYYFNRIYVGEKIDIAELISKIEDCNQAEWVVLNEKYRK